MSSIRKIEPINLRSGDMIVLQHPGNLCQKERENIKADIKEAFGDVPVVILQEGMTFGVVSGIKCDRVDTTDISSGELEESRKHE